MFLQTNWISFILTLFGIDAKTMKSDFIGRKFPLNLFFQERALSDLSFGYYKNREKNFHVFV